MQLPIAVNTAIALLNADQGPRDVVVNQLVALQVEVHALRSHVPGDQHTNGARGLLEGLHEFLLLHVREAAMQNAHLVRLELQVPRQVLSQPFQGGNPLCKDHGAFGRSRAHVLNLQLRHKFAVLTGTGRGAVLGQACRIEVPQSQQRFLFRAGSGIALDRAQARVDRGL